MYSILLNGREVRCETAAEALALCEPTTPPRATMPTAPKLGRPAKASTTETANGVQKKRRKKRAQVVTHTSDAQIKKLPYVENPGDWSEVEKVMKQLGRTDKMQLRTDLVRRKALGKTI